MAILECKDLTKYYDRTLGLDHLSLQLEPGRIVGLLGPNGSGKTTLLKIANGLLTPSSGQLLIDGKAPGPDTRRLVSYLPERTYLSDWMTVVQLLDFFCDFYPDFDREAAEHMLTALEISPTQRIKQMSKGTREKVQLILVMSRRTRLYLLDEPIGGVDPATRDYIIHTILTNFNPDSTLLISTHLIAFSLAMQAAGLSSFAFQLTVGEQIIETSGSAASLLDGTRFLVIDSIETLVACGVFYTLTWYSLQKRLNLQ